MYLLASLVLMEACLCSRNWATFTKLRLYQDTLWIDAVISGIQELCKNLSLREMLGYLSGSFYSPRLLIPRVEKDKQDKIVGFELSQNALPLAELIWDTNY